MLSFATANAFVSEFQETKFSESTDLKISFIESETISINDLTIFNQTFCCIKNVDVSSFIFQEPKTEARIEIFKYSKEKVKESAANEKYLNVENKYLKSTSRNSSKASIYKDLHPLNE